MDRKSRLNRSMDIQRVRQKGMSFAHPLFVLIVLPDVSVDQSQVGVIATKSVGGAVERNSSKRKLRAAVDNLMPNIPPHLLILLIARKRILEADEPDVEKVLESQLKKAAAYRSSEPEESEAPRAE